MHLPSPNNQFLTETVAGLRKRSKALNQKWVKPTCDRNIIRNGEKNSEALEIKVKLATRTGTLSFSAQIYDDRWVYLFSRKSIGLKVMWEWSAEGRLLDQDLVADLIGSIESTGELLSTYSDLEFLSEEERADLNIAWSSLIANGPTGIVRKDDNG